MGLISHHIIPLVNTLRGGHTHTYIQTHTYIHINFLEKGNFRKPGKVSFWPAHA